MPTITARRATAPPAAAPPLDFGGRLVLAGLSTPDTALNLADVITALPTGQRLTPVAALFHRAEARILHPSGWSREAGSDGCGGTCLINVIIAEAPDHGAEREARLLLREVVGGGEPIPQFNRQLRNAGQAAQILRRAASLAEKRGI